MKKRVLSVLLAAFLSASSLSTPAFASDIQIFEESSCEDDDEEVIIFDEESYYDEYADESGEDSFVDMSGGIEYVNEDDIDGEVLPDEDGIIVVDEDDICDVGGEDAENVNDDSYDDEIQDDYESDYSESIDEEAADEDASYEEPEEAAEEASDESTADEAYDDSDSDFAGEETQNEDDFDLVKNAGTFTITYELDGGVNNPANPESYTSTTKTFTLKKATKNGYTFSGWYSDESFTTKVTSIKKGSSGDKILYAKWTANKYTVKFDGNGATRGSMPSMKKREYDSSFDLNLNAFEKKGYTFREWNTKKSGKGDSYGDGANVTNLSAQNGSAVTLYAQWDIVTYDVTYELTDGAVNAEDNPTSFTVTSPSIKLKTPTREGYAFVGWYKDEARTKKITQISKGTAGNLTLYDKWDIIRYTIKFNGNNSTGGKMANIKNCESFVPIDLPANSFERKGYEFTGWNTKADGSGTDIADGATVVNLATKKNETIKLYAQWNMVTYSIDYDPDGGINDENNPVEYTVATKTIKLKKPVKEGYVFKGWYKDPDYNKKITQISKGSAGNLSLYAKWDIVRYSIKFYGNKATGGKMAVMKDCEYFKSYTLLENSFVKSGCEFDCWNTKADGSGKSYEDMAEVMNLTKENGETVKLYAQWKGEVFSITYVLNEGINDPENPEEYYMASPTIKLKDATRQYYTFGGWYSNSELTKKVTEIKSGSVGDITLYAKWKPFNYTVSFNGNGASLGKMDPLKNCISDETYTLTENSFIYPGYEFLGWNTQADGLGSFFADSAQFINLAEENNASIIMYAQWSMKTFSITYNLNGGTNAVGNPTSFTVETATIELKDATHTKYAFGGWYADADFAERIISIPKGSVEDLVLYAKWVKEIKAENYGAKPDDNKDDTDAINDAIQEAAEIAEDEKIYTEVTLGNGVYNIYVDEYSTFAIKMRTNVTLSMDKDTLLSVGNSKVSTDSGVICFHNIKNSGVSGGKLVGNYKYNGNIDVYGVWVKGCRNISISGMDICNNQCDGIYLSVQQVNGPDNVGNNGVYITGCTVHNNARNNICIVDADNVKIKNCDIYNTGDRSPNCGICIEPNLDDMSGDKLCTDILIQDTTIKTGKDKNNWQYRTFYTYNNKGNNKLVAKNVYIKHCTLTGYFGNYNATVYVSKDTVIDGTAEGLVRKD